MTTANVNNEAAIEAAFRRLTNSGTWCVAKHTAPQGLLGVHIQETAHSRLETICFVTPEFYDQVVSIARRVWILEAKAHGVQSQSDSWTCWALFGPAITDEEAILAAGRFGIEEAPYNGGPGQSFARRPSVQRTATRVLVTQRGGLDI